MSLNDFIILCFCLIGDALLILRGGKRLWHAGP